MRSLFSYKSTDNAASFYAKRRRAANIPHAIIPVVALSAVIPYFCTSLWAGMGMVTAISIIACLSVSLVLAGIMSTQRAHDALSKFNDWNIVRSNKYILKFMWVFGMVNNLVLLASAGAECALKHNIATMKIGLGLSLHAGAFIGISVTCAYHAIENFATGIAIYKKVLSMSRGLKTMEAKSQVMYTASMHAGIYVQRGFSWTFLAIGFSIFAVMAISVSNPISLVIVASSLISIGGCLLLLSYISETEGRTSTIKKGTKCGRRCCRTIYHIAGFLNAPFSWLLRKFPGAQQDTFENDNKNPKLHHTTIYPPADDYNNDAPHKTIWLSVDTTDSNDDTHPAAAITATASAIMTSSSTIFNTDFHRPFNRNNLAQPNSTQFMKQ